MTTLEKQGSKKALVPINTESQLKLKSSTSPKPSNLDKSSAKKAPIKPMPEKKFSPHILQIIRRLRFRLKLYMAVKRAKEDADKNTEPTHPEYKILVKILKNPYRSNESAQRVLEYVRHLPFFNEFINSLGDVEDRALQELCKRLKYEYVPAGTYVFKEGERSDQKYYIILRGQVSVIKKRDTNVFYQMRLQRLKAIDEEKTQEEILMETLIGEMGVKTKDINEGEGFEEKALSEKNLTRNCSILTNVNCEFIVVLKEDYNQIVSRFDHKRIVKKEFMMKNIPFIDSINSMAIIEDLFFFLKDEDYPKDAVLASENHAGNHIYFIGSGECTVEKTFIINNTRRGTDYGSFEVKKVIATIDTRSCFGEELLLEDNNVYKYTVKVKSSSASFYCVDKTTFMMRFPPECLRMVMESFQLKNSVHQARIAEIEKDIFETARDKNEPPPKLKGAEIFRLLRPQYRMKMAQHLYKSLKSNINSVSSSRDLQPIAFESQKNKNHVQVDNNEDGSPRFKEQIEPSTPSAKAELRTKTPGRVLLSNNNEIQSLQIGNKSLSSGYQRTIARRQADFKPDSDDTISFNKTLREKSSRDWIVTSRKDTSLRANGVTRNSPTSKRDEVDHVEPDKIVFSDYFSNAKPKMEKFDFGPSPYLTDRFQKVPRTVTNSHGASLGSFQTLKMEPSSATLKIGHSDFTDAVQQSRHELTNIIERVRGDRASPAVFSKLTGLTEKKRSISNKKKARKMADENLIMIKSIAASSVAKGSMDFSDCSPIQRLSGSRTFKGSMGFDAVVFGDSSPQHVKKEETAGSLEYLEPETPNVRTKSRVKISRDTSKSMSENKLVSLMRKKKSGKDEW